MNRSTEVYPHQGRPWLLHGQRAMLPTLVASMLWGSIPRAAAQDTGGFTARVISVAGRTPGEYDLETVPINRQECDDNATIRFILEQVPQPRASLVVFAGDNCNEARVERETNCVRVHDEAFPVYNNNNIGPITRYPFEMGARELVEALGHTCNDNLGTRTLWFAAVDDPSTTSALTDYTRLPVRFATRRPVAPIDFRAPDGESQVRVTWEVPSSATADHFIVYVDTNVPVDVLPGGGGAGMQAPPPEEMVDPDAGIADGGLGDAGFGDAGFGDAGFGDAGFEDEDEDEDGSNVDDGLAAPASCASAVLIPGQTPPSGLRTFRAHESSDRGLTINPRLSEDQPIVAAGVAMVDRAGNVGRLSNVACIEYKPSYGFGDQLDVRTGCAVAPVRSAAGTLGALALAVLGLVWTARRRRG